MEPGLQAMILTAEHGRNNAARALERQATIGLANRFSSLPPSNDPINDQIAVKSNMQTRADKDLDAG